MISRKARKEREKAQKKASGPFSSIIKVFSGANKEESTGEGRKNENYTVWETVSDVDETTPPPAIELNSRTINSLTLVDPELELSVKEAVTYVGERANEERPESPVKIGPIVQESILLNKKEKKNNSDLLFAAYNESQKMRQLWRIND